MSCGISVVSEDSGSASVLNAQTFDLEGKDGDTQHDLLRHAGLLNASRGKSGGVSVSF